MTAKNNPSTTIRIMTNIFCFSPIFYLYATLKIVSAVLMLFINLEFKTPAASVVSDVISVLKKMELIALFIACFILGKFLLCSEPELIMSEPKHYV